MECGDCHAATGSKLAADILMPEIATCRSCHGGERATDLLPSSCVSCHSFHLESQAHWHGKSELPEAPAP
jgi:predicted CXXCH cytochrome family protein